MLLSRVSDSRKWLGFVTAIWVQAIAGNNYTFSNYSDALKSLMVLNQMQLNNLSVAKDIGKAFGLLSGLASDALPTPVLLIIGSLEGFIGYGVQWLVVSRRISPLPYWQMCIFLCMGGNSTTWMNTAVLVTCMRNFPKNRGPVSGILKGYLGLSTAIFTDICTALFSKSPSTFLLMLTVIPAIVCLTAILFLRENPPASSLAEEQKEAGYLNVLNVSAVVLAIYLLAFDITGDHGQVISVAFAVGLLMLLSSPLAVPSYSLVRAISKFQPGSSDVEQVVNEPLLVQEKSDNKAELAHQQKADKIEETVIEVKQKKLIGEDHTMIEAFQTIDFWIMFLSFLCGVGTGMCVMNNMAQMGLALGYTDVSIFISLISILGFFGRILSGLLSEFYIWKSATPRPIWNAASQVVMAVGYVVMAIGFPGSLYIGSILVGMCYGVRLTITVSVASELFGLKYYGLLYNILILNLPLGSFLFSGLLAGFLYDLEATITPDGQNTCSGPHCFRLVFLIMSAACALGFGLDVLLTLRTRHIYLKIYEAKNSREVTILQ